MADDADRADELAYELLKRSIAYASTRPPELSPIGECWNCHAALESGLRFCDRDCMDDYVKRNKLK